MENREDGNQHLRGIFPGPKAGGAGGTGGSGAGSSAGRRGSEEMTSAGYNAPRWTGDAQEQMAGEGTRRPSQDALFNQVIKFWEACS